MTTRKPRIYLVALGNETKLVRANGAGQAIQTVAKDFIRARVAESEDLIRIANDAGAGLSVAAPQARDPNVKRGPGRPPKTEDAPIPAAPQAPSDEPPAYATSGYIQTVNPDQAAA